MFVHMNVCTGQNRKCQFEHNCPLKHFHASISKDAVTFYIQEKLFKVSFYYFLRFEAKKKKRLLGEWVYRFFVKSFLNKILNVFIWHVKEDSLNVLF